jgi:hypothetical protein
MMVCAVIILFEAFRRWYRVLVLGQYSLSGKAVCMEEEGFQPPDFGCC